MSSALGAALLLKSRAVAGRASVILTTRCPSPIQATTDCSQQPMPNNSKSQLLIQQVKFNHTRQACKSDLTVYKRPDVALQTITSRHVEQDFAQVAAQKYARTLPGYPMLAALPWVDQEMSSPVVTGAILPLAQQNFLQILFFPYTYAVMYYMDFLLTHMPWWLAIVATTATARLMFFPVVLKQNVIGIKQFNLMPQTQRIQQKLNDAMCSGDSYTQAMCKTKLAILYKEHNLTMKDRLMPLLIQAPMYASIFLLLRGLTSIPVEGLATGGAFWFTDLTLPDPYYILPTITCTSMFLLFEFGLEGSIQPSQSMGPMGRYFMRGMPLILFAFIHSFPAATLLFWSTSNLFTLFYALTLKTKWAKSLFNIPARLIHDPSTLPLANQSFRGQVRQAIDKGKATRTTLDVRRLDDIAFRKAGIGPLRKTHKEPPIKT